MSAINHKKKFDYETFDLEKYLAWIKYKKEKRKHKKKGRKEK